jgi:hypothetical protein
MNKKYIIVGVGVILIMLCIGIGSLVYLYTQLKKSDQGIITNTPLPTQTKNSNITSTPADIDFVIDNTDSDKDTLPDWLESEIGTDSTIAECSEYLKDCGEVGDYDASHQYGDNLLVIMDFSGSMNEKLPNGKTRLQAAKESFINYINTLDLGSTRFGFIAYGHKGNNTYAGKETSCSGIELKYELQQINKAEVTNMVNSIPANGWTPIAASLQAAEGVLKDLPSYNQNRSTILLITDGEETCDGDPVVEAKRIKDSGVDVMIDVIALGSNTELDAKLKPIADSGGGNYISVKDEVDSWNNLYKEYDKIWRESLSVGTCNFRTKLDISNCEFDIRQNKLWPYTQSLDINDPRKELMYNFDKDKINIINDFIEYRERLIAPYDKGMDDAIEKDNQNDQKYEDSKN